MVFESGELRWNGEGSSSSGISLVGKGLMKQSSVERVKTQGP